MKKMIKVAMMRAYPVEHSVNADDVVNNDFLRNTLALTW